MKKVAIVILNFNGEKDTIQCLESIERLQVTRLDSAKRVGYRLQVIVVDNGSVDGSVNELKNFTLPALRFTLIENKENLGFAEGNNVGIRVALKDGADYVLILNNDTLVDKNLILQLIKTFSDYHDAGIISPKIYFAPGFEFHKTRYKKNERGKVIWYAGGKLDWDNILSSHRGVDEVDSGQYDRVVETDFATGACMMIKLEVFKKIGLLDKDYFLYWEDVDFCQRAKKAGFKVLYTPTTHIWHKVARGSGIGSNLNDYYITRNRLLFASKYAVVRAKFALLRESLKMLFSGRPWQWRGVIDYYFGNLDKGSYLI